MSSPGNGWERLDGPLPIELANTLRRRRDSYVDLIAEPLELAGWMHATGLATPDPEDLVPRLADIRRCRDAVFALLLAAAGNDRLPEEPLEQINTLIPAVRRTLLPDRAVHEDREAAGSGIDRLLTRLAEATVGYLSDEAAAERLGWCVAPSCGRFFVRRRSDAHWCSAACGTRARVARHAARRRQGQRSTG